MSATTDFIVVGIATAAGLVAILDWLGIKPSRPVWGLLMPLGRNWKLGIMLALLIISFGFSARGYYRSLHPQIIERIVEKPVDRIVEKPLPCPEPKSPAVPNPQSIKKPSGIEANPTTTAKPIGAVSPPTQNCPNGICNAGNNLGNQTVNNFAPPPANFTFTEEVVTPFSPGSEKVMTVHIKPDRSIPGAIVGVVFSGPFTLTNEEPRLLGASASQVSWGTLVEHGTTKQIPNSLFIRVNLPAAFNPHEELVIPIKSSSDVHVVEVGNVN